MLQRTWMASLGKLRRSTMPALTGSLGPFLSGTTFVDSFSVGRKLLDQALRLDVVYERCFRSSALIGRSVPMPRRILLASSFTFAGLLASAPAGDDLTLRLEKVVMEGPANPRGTGE